jgi:hypothetical protein
MVELSVYRNTSSNSRPYEWTRRAKPFTFIALILPAQSTKGKEFQLMEE